MSGNVTLSLSEFDSCDKTAPDEANISERCCNFNDITLDFETNVSLKTFKPSSSLNSISHQIFSRQFPEIKKSSFNNYTNLPPPGGTELLKRVQVFRL